MPQRRGPAQRPAQPRLRRSRARVGERPVRLRADGHDRGPRRRPPAARPRLRRRRPAGRRGRGSTLPAGVARARTCCACARPRAGARRPRPAASSTPARRPRGGRTGVRLDARRPRAGSSSPRATTAAAARRCDGTDLGEPEIGAGFGTAWRVPAACRERRDRVRARTAWSRRATRLARSPCCSCSRCSCCGAAARRAPRAARAAPRRRPAHAAAVGAPRRADRRPGGPRARVRVRRPRHAAVRARRLRRALARDRRRARSRWPAARSSAIAVPILTIADPPREPRRLQPRVPGRPDRRPLGHGRRRDAADPRAGARAQYGQGAAGSSPSRSAQRRRPATTSALIATLRANHGSSASWRASVEQRARRARRRAPAARTRPGCRTGPT